MSSTSSQDIKSSQTHQSAQSINEQSTDASSVKGADSGCNSPTVLTGEFRMSFRERIQRMRDGKGGTPAPLHPAAAKNATPDSSIAPLTPPINLASPKCPGAPRKRKVFDLRKLSQGDSAAGKDTPTNKENEEAKQPLTVLDTSLHRSFDTPDRQIVVQQSLGPNDFAHINARLQSFLKTGAKPEHKTHDSD
ncbi:hypothetical protein F5X97DRAFT_328811 [Nemania serpens]|nr:hypothetical protein F5X97DRAFT_328811 [Nemania serpens]